MLMATSAPSRASRFAIAAPTPRDLPVTNATFPASFFAMRSLTRANFVPVGKYIPVDISRQAQ
jgi:hypothetical protein